MGTNHTRAAIRDSLATSDLRRVLEFRRKVEDLLSTRVLTDRSVGGWQGETNVVLSVRPTGVEMPTDREMSALYIHFRHFMLNDAPTYFPKVRNIVAAGFRKAGIDSPPGSLQAFKDDWSMRTIGYPIGGMDLIDCVINTAIFHEGDDRREARFQRKNKQLQDLCAAHGALQVSTWFRFALVRAMGVLVSFDKFLKELTDVYAET